MSWSTPDGGQITPLESASSSLSDLEPPRPTVGGSPLTSGGQAAALSLGMSRGAGAAMSWPAEVTDNASDNAKINVMARMAGTPPNSLTAAQRRRWQAFR